ncbi:MAG: hypothetical protein ACI4UE_04775 [Candidatus Scatovivens sp.]
MKKLYIISDKIIKSIIIILTAIALINMLLKKDNIYIPININKIIIIMFFIILFFILLKLIRNNVKLNKDIKKVLKIVFIGIILIIQIVYVLSIYRLIGFDPIRIYSGALEMVEGLKMCYINLEYFSRCYNNIPLLLIYFFIFSIVKSFNLTNYLLAVIFLNIIIVDLSIFIIYKILKKLLGNNYDYLSFAFTVPMLAITPWIGAVYSDTLSLIFPVLIFYLYLLYKDNHKIKYIIEIAITLAISVLIKPTNIIIFTAIIMIEFVKIISNCSKNKKINYMEYMKKIVAFSLTIILVILLYNFIQNSIINNYISKQDIKDNKFSFTHFIMMGLKDTKNNKNQYGMYYEYDVQCTKSYIGVGAKRKFNMQQIKNRLADMGIKGYINFIYNKYTWIISDGTFFYGREGNFYAGSEPKNCGEFAKKIQEYTYYDKEGFNNFTVNFEQAIWIVVLMLLLFDSLLNIKKTDDTYLNILRISVIGIILFILLFEARSRYLFHYLPIFIILAVNGIKTIDEKSLDFLNKLKKVKTCKYW